MPSDIAEATRMPLSWKFLGTAQIIIFPSLSLRRTTDISYSKSTFFSRIQEAQKNGDFFPSAQFWVVSNFCTSSNVFTDLFHFPSYPSSRIFTNPGRCCSIFILCSPSILVSNSMNSVCGILWAWKCFFSFSLSRHIANASFPGASLTHWDSKNSRSATGTFSNSVVTAAHVSWSFSTSCTSSLGLHVYHSPRLIQ